MTMEIAAVAAIYNIIRFRKYLIEKIKDDD
jgi:hypothetical protein